MVQRPDNTLDYAPKPNGWWTLWRIRRRTWILLAIAALVVFSGFSVITGPTSGQIRLDTGDLRYCWWGIPISYKRMPEPERSKILALAATAPAIRPQWVTCVTYPLPSTNNPDLMYRNFYYHVYLWSDVDSRIARWALEDIADDIGGRGPRKPLGIVIGFVDGSTGGSIDSNWRENEDVKEFCAEHGYIPPPATASMPAKAK